LIGCIKKVKFLLLIVLLSYKVSGLHFSLELFLLLFQVVLQPLATRAKLGLQSLLLRLALLFELCECEVCVRLAKQEGLQVTLGVDGLCGPLPQDCLTQGLKTAVLFLA
jgi:hypothetical protein